MSKALKDKIIIVNNFCFVFVYILMLSFRANKRVRYRFIPCFYLEVVRTSFQIERNPASFPWPEGGRVGVKGVEPSPRNVLA